MDGLGNQAESLEDDYDDEAHILGQHDFTETAWTIERVLHHVTPPLQRLERNATVPVNFLVLPIFAFVNAQVRVVGVDMGALLSDPVLLACLSVRLSVNPSVSLVRPLSLVKSHLFRLPVGKLVPDIAVGIMGGIGFTMSILIAGLAFSGPEIIAAKCANPCCSGCCECLGSGLCCARTAP
jgi:NhaA family Na+:H+ antiporter